MKPQVRAWIQIFLFAALAVAGARVLVIFLHRRQAAAPAKPAVAGKVNPDYYVYPPRSYLTDFNSAKALAGSTLWIREGWRYSSQPYDPVRHRSLADKAAAPIAPMQKIAVQDVISEPSRIPGVKQVDFVFEDPSASPSLRAIAVGTCEGPSDCRFYVDDMFFLKDPHELYTHWKPDVWKAIENREAREGMSEIQVTFALGSGRILPTSPPGERIVKFQPPGRPPVVVTFDSNGYARRIQ